MFGLLKNKLSNFISSLTGREEKKPSEQPSSKPPEKEAREKQQAEEKKFPEREQKKPVEAQAKKESKEPKSKRAETPVAEKRARTEPIPSHSEKKKALAEEKSVHAGKKPAPAETKAATHEAEKKQPPAEAAAVEKKREQEEKNPSGAKHISKPAASSPVEIETAIKKEQEQERQPIISKPEPEGKPAIIAPAPSLPKEERKKSIFDIVASPFSKKPEQKKESAAAAPEPEKLGQKHAAPKMPEPLAKTKQEIRVPAPVPSALSEPEQEIKTPSIPEHDLSRLERRASSGRHEIAPKIGIGASIKSFFSSEITIGEAEVSDLLDELELSLLEADVAYEVSSEVISQLRSSLVGMKVPKTEVEARTKDTIRAVLESVMDSDKKFAFVERIKSLPKTVKILFVGPNGAGKTTTMAKLARMLMDSGLTVVFSASDTFRAAAIEQTEVHASRLGVKVIKSKYGADPASVAFDAINYARANSIDVVLIDSAGRQDTNANLLSELVKINRIAKPDIKVYIGESIGGNAIIDQIRAFNEAIGMDGAILTKIDCDAKGGTAISVAKSTGIPVLFLGVGQGYNDLVPFDPHKIASEIMG